MFGLNFGIILTCWHYFNVDIILNLYLYNYYLTKSFIKFIQLSKQPTHFYLVHLNIKFNLLTISNTFKDIQTLRFQNLHPILQ